MTNTRDEHPPGDQGLASQHLPVSETGGSHLAHWPPRLRGHEHRPVHVKLNQPGEPIQDAKHHGLGLTRSAFADEADE